jgi:hypothetical protein
VPKNVSSSLGLVYLQPSENVSFFKYSIHGSADGKINEDTQRAGVIVKTRILRYYSMRSTSTEGYSMDFTKEPCSILISIHQTPISNYIWIIP